MDRHTDIGKETEKQKQRQKVIDKETDTNLFLHNKSLFDTSEKVLKNSQSYIPVELSQ